VRPRLKEKQQPELGVVGSCLDLAERGAACHTSCAVVLASPQLALNSPVHLSTA
jgi:hypothetical protein